MGIDFGYFSKTVMLWLRVITSHYALRMVTAKKTYVFFRITTKLWVFFSLDYGLATANHVRLRLRQIMGKKSTYPNMGQ